MPTALKDPRVRKQVMQMKRHKPYFTCSMIVLNTAVMIFTFIWSYLKTGNIIVLNPPNPMIGPDSSLLIQLGAKFSPCIRNIAQYSSNMVYICPAGVNPKNATANAILSGKLETDASSNRLVKRNAALATRTITTTTTRASSTITANRRTTTANRLSTPTISAPTTTTPIASQPSPTAGGGGGSFPSKTTQYCTLEDVCGLFGFRDSKQPDQWYRFGIAMFLHGGILHLLANMFFLYRIGLPMEEAYGFWRIAVIYILSGIGGFMFGTNDTTPSVGASGSIYGIMGCVLLDLLLNFKIVTDRWKELLRLILTVVISLAIGLLPYIDNFAHIAGFIIGFLTAVLILPSINFGDRDQRIKLIAKGICAPLLLSFLAYLLIAFYTGTKANCPWCKYLDCIPIFEWCSGY
jgi:membrane associated rhomboid family serine protease